MIATENGEVKLSKDERDGIIILIGIVAVIMLTIWLGTALFDQSSKEHELKSAEILAINRHHIHLTQEVMENEEIVYLGIDHSNIILRYADKDGDVHDLGHWSDSTNTLKYNTEINIPEFVFDYTRGHTTVTLPYDVDNYNSTSFELDPDNFVVKTEGEYTEAMEEEYNSLQFG